MPFRFRCPACNSVISAAEDLAGSHMTCAMCDAVLEIPKPPKKAAPAPPRKSETPRPNAEPTPKEETSDAVADEAPLGFRSRKRPPDDEMDMTPMVDVTFQLLIFFMLTASFVLQRSLEIPKPESKDASSGQTVEEVAEMDDVVSVRIDENGTYFMSAAALGDDIEIPSEQELIVRLRQARQPDSQGRIPNRLLVQAHGDAIHKRVVSAIDAGNEAGMEKVQLVTKDDDS